MAQAGGLSAQFGMVDESTFNTPVTVSRFLEFNDETLAQSIDRVESSGLRVGRRLLRSTQFVPGHIGVSGDVEMEVQRQGMGLMLKHMLGVVATSQPNSGTAPTVYEHKFTVGQIDGKSFTAQIGKGDTGGTQRAFTYSGCKVNKWELSCDVDGFLMLKNTIDAASELTTTALATASYASGGTLPLAWTGASITLPNSATGNVSKFDLTGDNGQATDRYFMSGTGSATKKEQIEESLRVITGTCDTEFTDLTLYNQFVTGAVGSLTAFFEGANIASTYNYALEVTLPAVRFDGVTPNVDGDKLIIPSMTFTAMDDGAGTGGCQMTYRTIDTTP